MKISIVTPVLNDTRVARALDSVLAQRHRHTLELIVVDGGSTDGTPAILDRYRNRIAALISEPDDGIFDGMNKGIRRATGDVVGILCADDRYSDQFVFRDVLRAFEDAAVEACYGDQTYVNEQGRTVRHWRAGAPSRAAWHAGWMPPHPTFFVRRRTYQEYGGFDTRFPIAADYELMLRLLFRHRIRTVHLDRVLVHMAPGGTSTASAAAILQGNREAFLAWRSNGLRGGWFVPVLKPARKLLQLARPRLLPSVSAELPHTT